MKVNLPPLNQTPTHHYTDRESLPAKLEAKMFEKQLYSVGSVDSWKNRVNEKGEERLGSLDMSQEARAYRTMDVRKLALDELKRIQSHELRRMTRFVIGPTEMRIILKNENIRDQVFIQPHQIEHIIKFNDQHRPALNRKFLDLFIPPYFVYDYDFDGMRYHHAWDLCVWNLELDLPKAKGKKGNAVEMVESE